MTNRITATEARVRFGELMRRVAETNEPVVVERAGKPAVVLVSMDTWEKLRGNDRRRARLAVLDRTERVRRDIARHWNDGAPPSATDVLDDTRKARDEQLSGLR